tara:strand:+ start:2227 stop:2439 length:213 start_codon:yes stop_codon:yes gene_type:complete
MEKQKMATHLDQIRVDPITNNRLIGGLGFSFESDRGVMIVAKSAKIQKFSDGNEMGRKTDRKNSLNFSAK